MANLQKTKYLLQNLAIKQKLWKEELRKIATNYIFICILYIGPANSNLQKNLKIL